MNIDSIKRGIVIDHIHAGRSMDIYKYLHLDELECSVAIIKNVKSSLMGRKDIIKIDDNINVDLDVLGYIDPDVTINIIEDGRIVEKKHIALPEKLVNVIRGASPPWSRSWTRSSSSPTAPGASTAAFTARRSASHDQPRGDRGVLAAVPVRPRTAPKRPLAGLLPL